jgi:hypothetical protein
MGQDNAAALEVVDAAYRANEVQKRILFDKAVARFGADGLAGKQFAVWGLAFKPDTDDMREAPSKVLIDGLLDAGATVARLWWQLPLLAGRNNCAASGCVAEAATLARVDAGAALPPAAQAIKDASGPRSWLVAAAFATQSASRSPSPSASAAASPSAAASTLPGGSASGGASASSSPSAAAPAASQAASEMAGTQSGGAAGARSASATATSAPGELSAAVATPGTEAPPARTVTAVAAAVGGAAAAAAAFGGLFYALVVRPRARRGRVLRSVRAPAPPQRDATENPLAVECKNPLAVAWLAAAAEPSAVNPRPAPR